MKLSAVVHQAEDSILSVNAKRLITRYNYPAFLDFNSIQTETKATELISKLRETISARTAAKNIKKKKT